MAPRPSMLDPAGEQAAYERAQRRTRIIGRLIVGVLALVVMAGGIGGVLSEKLFNKVTFTKPLGSVLGNASRPPKAVPNPSNGTTSGGTARNILILGVDSRLGENSQFQVTNGAKQTESLSDTAILAHLAADGKHVTLVSIPRDSVVEIPACEKVDAGGNPILDSSGADQFTKPVKALFNEAIQLGGPYCSAKTLEGLTGIHIDNYLEIDFTGVVKMSEALGGVPLTICKPIHDTNTGLNLPAGPVNLVGDQALAFVRARYGLTGGDDLHRIQRQQQFMAAMVRKALQSASFFNPTTMYSFYSAVAGSLSTDLGRTDLVKLAIDYRHTDTSSIVFVTVPTYPAPKGDPFYEHLYWSDDEAKALFSDINNDRTITVTNTGGANVGSVTISPSSVSVKVLNGTTTDGLARQVRDELLNDGFNVVSYGSAASDAVAKTTVTYEASRTTSMQTLVGVLASPPNEVVDASAGSTITLTVGQDWAGLATASASASPSAAGSGSASSPASPAASVTAAPDLKASTATTQNCVQG